MTYKTYLRRRAAAEYLRENRGIPTSEKTLAKLACIGGGPVYRLFGRIPLYLIADLDTYAEGKLSKPVRSTSEYGSGR
jgi:hypothetical protein